jgi:hypothetical protein
MLKTARYSVEVVCVELGGREILRTVCELRRIAASQAVDMRDVDVIESELRLIAAVRRTAAEVGAPPPRIGPIDQLLDEWLESTTIDQRGDPLTAN